MAYSALPKPARKMISAPPRGGAPSSRSEPVSHSATANPVKTAGVAELSAAGTSDLLRFLFLLVVISGLTCLYVWQADAISAIRYETNVMTEEIRALERQNVSLMLAHARWDAPDYIEAESNRSGMIVGQIPVRVQLPESGGLQGAAGPDIESGLSIRRLTAWIPGPLTTGSQPK
jgi:hypothetical protein